MAPHAVHYKGRHAHRVTVARARQSNDLRGHDLSQRIVPVQIQDPKGLLKRRRYGRNGLRVERRISKKASDRHVFTSPRQRGRPL